MIRKWISVSSDPDLHLNKVIQFGVVIESHYRRPLVFKWEIVRYGDWCMRILNLSRILWIGLEISGKWKTRTRKSWIGLLFFYVWLSQCWISPHFCGSIRSGSVYIFVDLSRGGRNLLNIFKKSMGDWDFTLGRLLKSI